MTLNLQAPAGFRGLDEHRPLTVYHRKLPHWRQEGATYFITFHLSDALPKAKRNELKSLRRDWEARNPPPRSEAVWEAFAKVTLHQLEAWMDAGYGTCWFRETRFAGELGRSILHFHGQRYDVGAYVIMANHCHLVMRPFGDGELETDIGAIKSVVAHYINKSRGQAGDLWEQESYDRIVRDEEHLYRVIQYIGRNPRRANVPRSLWHRWINLDWQSLGWGFLDE